MKRILFIAGEASGDIHGANLIKSLNQLVSKKNIEVEYTGVGGQKMIDTGCFSLEFNNRDFAVFGLVEVIKHYPRLYSKLCYLKNKATLGAYDLAVLIDYPGFNMKLAEHLTKIGVPVIYYISPQVWAWKQKRVHSLIKNSREVVTVFPFEASFFKKFGYDVKYVGHPILDEVNDYLKNKRIQKNKQKTIAVLPGSRVGEISRIMPVLASACNIIKSRLKDDVNFIIPIAKTLSKAEILANIPCEFESLFTFADNSYDVFSVSDYAILASGTVTVESAVFEVPMTVVYKVNPISAFIFKNIIKYKRPIAMANILLNPNGNERVFSEFFQEQATDVNIAEDVLRYFESPQKEALKQKFAQSFKVIKESLYAQKSASDLTAELVMRYL